MSTQTFPRATRLGVGKPSPLTIGLGVLVGVLQLVNQLVLNDDGSYQARTAIAVALTLAGSLAIQPLFGEKLTTALHISKQALVAISAFLTALTGVLSIVALPTSVHAIVATVLSLIGSLMFGTPLRPAKPAPVTPVVP